MRRERGSGGARWWLGMLDVIYLVLQGGGSAGGRVEGRVVSVAVDEEVSGTGEEKTRVVGFGAGCRR